MGPANPRQPHSLLSSTLNYSSAPSSLASCPKAAGGGSCAGVGPGIHHHHPTGTHVSHRLRQQQRPSGCPTPSLHGDSSGLHHTPHWLSCPPCTTPRPHPGHPGTQQPCSRPSRPRLAPVSSAVEGTLMAPKDVLDLIPGPCECHLTWKTDCAGVVRSRVLRWGGCPGLTGLAPCHHKGP